MSEVAEIIQTLSSEDWRKYTHPETNHTYYISNLGDVRSYTVKGELHTHTSYKNNGYRCIPYRKNNGKNGLIYLHKIMLSVWVENPNEYGRYRFIDGNPSNCTVANLEWISNELFTSLNSERVKETLIYRKKRRLVTNSKLTEGRVAILKKRIIENEKKDHPMKWKLIAKQFGIKYGQLHSIRKGESWTHVNPAK